MYYNIQGENLHLTLGCAYFNALRKTYRERYLFREFSYRVTLNIAAEHISELTPEMRRNRKPM